MEDFDAGLTTTRKARIEIIPLIDVIFFLLATFVLFTLSLQKLRMIDVDLPQAGRPGPEDTTVFLQVSTEGTFNWQEGAGATPELLTTSELRPRLENYVRSVPVARVFIRSDRRAKFGAAVFALDEVRRAGIKQVSVETLAGAPGG